MEVGIVEKQCRDISGTCNYASRIYPDMGLAIELVIGVLQLVFRLKRENI